MSDYELNKPDIEAVIARFSQFITKLEGENFESSVIAYAAQHTILAYSLARCLDSKIVFINHLCAAIAALELENNQFMEELH